uniref:Uncharacterized protein n=1 Tax=Rhizophora mucronata TaxID=61149 RepID=A0A2P2LL29_RHIMU
MLDLESVVIFLIHVFPFLSSLLLD